ncbi:MAG: TIGR04295 family B12-binding domain-containing radical SAM protein [Alphaproteobacteria bacterium]|nr:TIGR04295 family B12-binding domain-containing radical SAM protein [Alphaproteobacteria bacterium]
MRVALVNPNWSFDGSIYFGCREPHLPLEYGYAKALLQDAGHTAEIFDAHADALDGATLADRVTNFAADLIAITTAPSYLFWRCAPPELRVPQQTLSALEGVSGTKVAVGPHGSTTPRATLRKLGVDVVALGECEETLVHLADRPPDRWHEVPGLCYASQGKIVVQGGPQAADVANLPALTWPAETLGAHRHHHHRFDTTPIGFGAEIEASRGCPYHCTFCAKENFRNRYRRRPLSTILAELDQLIAAGVNYVYFIDEIFLPWRQLLAAMVERDAHFGIQTRIDLWSREMLDLLGAAGCVSIEAGVESLTSAGRDWLEKNCKLSTHDLTELLIYAKGSVPFVQANLIASGDDTEMVQRWRTELRSAGVWANDPVPLFPYPGSPDYRRLWGVPDDNAWERAVDYYLERYRAFSEIQDACPGRLAALEAESGL